MDFRQRLFKSRGYTPIPFILVMIIIANPTLISLATGFCIVVAGESIRLWGVAIAGSETRTTGPVGGTFLITRGPFSYVRNPLYVGNILMYVGVGIMSNAVSLALAALVYFLWQYSLIVSLEEEYLVETFKDEYIRYCRSVPRFFPSTRKYPEGTNPQPDLDMKRGVVSEKRTLQAIVLLTVVLIILWRVRG